VFDVHETYYIGNNYELLRSFDPRAIPFHASWGPTDPDPEAELHATWHLFIHGDGGLLLIRPRGMEYLDAKGRYRPHARKVMPLCRELSGGIGMLRIASDRADDPIAVYHSQANLRLHWIRRARQSGTDWVDRTSRSERTDNRYFLLRESWVKAIEDNGFQYRFLCPPQVASGGLKAHRRRTGEGFKALVLPEILAMSTAEAAAIRRFVRTGGVVIADQLPGTFDEHGKRRVKSPLADLFADGAGGRAVLLNRDFLAYHRQRLDGREGALKSLVSRHLTAAVGVDRVTPLVTGPRGEAVTGVEVTVWRNGEAELIALHRNGQQRIDEVVPGKTNRRFCRPVTLTVRRKARARWHDVRTGRELGVGRQVDVRLDPYEPVFLLAAPPVRDRGPRVTVADGRIVIAAGAAGLARPVYHLAFLGPDGKERLVYRRNVTLDRTGGSLPLPLALNDAPGPWTLAVREVATGRQVEVPFDLAT
ncbi:MAG TPA: hypothetical protein VFJ30_14230, partial [Phycisphaerae bacterium]|nr:hypothetical protein [Phycisphaerae bacterium]